MAGPGSSFGSCWFNNVSGTLSPPQNSYLAILTHNYKRARKNIRYQSPKVHKDATEILVIFFNTMIKCFDMFLL